MNHPLPNRDISIPDTWDRRGLPGWCYRSPAFLELEKDRIFRTHWQIACHVSDIAESGDFITLDICDERALILKDSDGQIRAFHNLCRHRGSRVVAEESGRCKNALVCPFHGWVYNLDGTLRGASQPRSFPEMDKHEFGLKPINLEIWNGLVFIRFAAGPQPTVRELMEPFAEEIGLYRMKEMIPAAAPWTSRSNVNWKSVRDVDNEGYHVALAHPALQDLYGRSYYDEPFVNGVARSHAVCNESGGRCWSVRHYLDLTKPQEFHPEQIHRVWIYYGLFPNAVIAVTPESMQFYQEFPLSPGETLLRGASYHYREETRPQRLARYLAMRIDRETMEEDVQLSEWSNESMKSKAFDGFFLSDLEYGVRTHHDQVRNLLPVCTLQEAPAEDRVAALNSQMSG